ncbi:MAG: DEAD/DEAH box helicase [Pantoea sp. Brub]|nr:DEAD/DEAH box helicase [Pantoea sp. Brub]
MTDTQTNFDIFGLNSDILKSLKNMGYIKPSPIQYKCIPYLLSGRDVLGMAQTGSGKTAAFALPLLNNINIELKAPQILIMAVTRELAIQVTEAITNFSKYMKGLHVIAIYGGQRYEIQLKSLRHGPQVIVGTPGRLLDHLKRGTLNLSSIKGLVLDEADEMLRMGFIEDVKTIIQQIPTNHQTALFSATMPEEIKRITKFFMKNPQEIYIKSNSSTRPDINQSYWPTCGRKIDALMRFLEVEDFDAAIIFVRTKNATLEISSTLEKNGYNTAALNSDINQAIREQTLERLKNYRLDILIATDVAARGLDVDRVSLVINYDIPMDAESYVHRIGRTGRAGRTGKALLFVENRERRLLRNIERSMKLTIPEIKLPNSEFLGQRRLDKITAKVQQQLEHNDLEQYRKLLHKMNSDKKLDIETLAIALLKIAQGKRPLVLPSDNIINNLGRNTRFNERDRKIYYSRKKLEKSYNNRFNNHVDDKMQLYRIEVGLDDGVEIRHIVGAIANEGAINSRYIGSIKLFNNHSTIELPKKIANLAMQSFTHTKIFNKPINIQLLGDVRLNKFRKMHSKFSRYSQNQRFNVEHRVNK